jgi:peptide/nickel transport system ATP-binding protein
MNPLLEVRSLFIDIPLPAGMLHAVRDVSFTVRRGETVCLVGESGCGKSLSALAIMDLLPSLARRRADRLLFEDTDLVRIGPRGMADIRGHRMAMIFQEPMTSLNPCYTIGNQLVEACSATAAYPQQRLASVPFFYSKKSASLPLLAA